MRICHIISSLDSRSGGPSTALRGLAAAQQRAGMDVVVAATFRSGSQNDIANELLSLGIPVNLIGPAAGPLSRHPTLPTRVSDSAVSADVVHIHALWEEIQHQAATVARRQNIPYIFRPCGMLDPWSLAQSKWKKKLYMAWRLRKDLDGAAMLHFTSATERDLVRPLQLKPTPVVVPNGVRFNEFEQLPPRGTFRQRFPQIGERPLVLFMSRIHHKKGLDLLVPAFAKAQLGDAILAIAGPDPDGYAKVVQEMVSTHNLADHVVFVGMLRGQERVAALADADLFALPSYQENFGIAVVEALAAGCPVVISDQVNIHHEIASAKVGGVVPLNVETLATELRRWMTDPVLRKQASSRARPFVQSHYDWNQIARRWAELYAQLRPTPAGAR